MYYTIFQSPVCEIILVGDNGGLNNLHMNTNDGKREFKIEENWQRKDDFFSGIRQQLDEYFAGSRIFFDVKLNMNGTDFQKSTWNKLREIPFGETWTYKKLATECGNPNASRAVGMANSHNPIPIIVPCHRVVGSNGKLTGFAHGLAAKEALLVLEKQASAPLMFHI